MEYGGKMLHSQKLYKNLYPRKNQFFNCILIYPLFYVSLNLHKSLFPVDFHDAVVLELISQPWPAEDSASNYLYFVRPASKYDIVRS